MAREGWISVTHAAPCPICEGTDNCKVSTEGKAVWCGRVASERQNKGGQYLHWLEDGNQWLPRIQPPRTQPKKPPKEFAGLDKFHELGKQNYKHLRYWCERYCVPESEWLAIHGYALGQRLVTPELCDEAETVVGIVRREIQQDGSTWKGAGKGHSRGVTIAKPPCGKGHAVIIVEGASDTAAANAAGFEAMGRSTRDADLTVFRKLLSEVPDSTAIVVMVENDSPPARFLNQFTDETWAEHITNQTIERVMPLVEYLGRPIIVARPPRDQNDFCDWWKCETARNGHLLNPAERHAIGAGMAKAFIETGFEVLPPAAMVRKFRCHDYDKLDQRMFLVSETLRQESLERGEGIDADYQAAESCSFSKSFRRTKPEERKTQYLFGFLSCRSWRCLACRERKLKPGWCKHLALEWLDESEFWRLDMTAVEFKRAKKRIEHKKADYAAIWKDKDQVTVYATCDLGEGAKVWDLDKFLYAYGRLIDSLQADVFAISPDKSRPVTASKNWLPDDEVELKHVFWKLKRIGQETEKAKQKLFVGELSREAGENLIREIKQLNKKFPVKKINFFAVNVGEKILLMCSKSQKKISSRDPMDAIEEISQAVGWLGEDRWKTEVRTSKAWAPRKTKQWLPLDCNVSPEDAREAAKSVQVAVIDITADEAHGAFVDRALVQFSENDAREDLFLRKIEAVDGQEVGDDDDF